MTIRRHISVCSVMRITSENAKYRLTASSRRLATLTRSSSSAAAAAAAEALSLTWRLNQSQPAALASSSSSSSQWLSYKLMPLEAHKDAERKSVVMVVMMMVKISHV